jgi:hypothetical protein
MFERVRSWFSKKPEVAELSRDELISMQLQNYWDVKDRQREVEKYENLFGASLLMEAEYGQDPKWTYAINRWFADA